MGPLKRTKKAFSLSPAEAPRGRLRRYLNNRLKGPFLDFLVLSQAQEDICGTGYIFEGPFSQSVILATALLHNAHTDDWDGALNTFPEARALNYQRLTFKDTACVAVQINQMCDGKAGDTVGSFPSFVFRWAFKAGVRPPRTCDELSARRMAGGPPGARLLPAVHTHGIGTPHRQPRAGTGGGIR